MRFDTWKNIFACLFSVHNTISLSCHEQVCLTRLRFERYLSHHRQRKLLCHTYLKKICGPGWKQVATEVATEDRVATEDKSNIVYEIDCSNCEAVSFGESKRSLKPR